MARMKVSRWRGRWIAGPMVALLVLGGGLGLHLVHAQGPQPGGWLGKLPADKQTEAIDRQLRGFDMAMFEVNAIKKKDIALFKQRVDALRAACNACHAAEAVAFIRVGIPSIKQTPLVNN